VDIVNLAHYAEGLVVGSICSRGTALEAVKAIPLEGGGVRTIREVVNLALVGVWFGGIFLLPAKGQDVVVFKNGDRLSGTIKYLDHGQLIFSSPLIDGDAKLNWRQIARVESERVFQLQTIAGERFLGRIGKSAGSGESADELVIIMSDSEQKLRRNEIDWLRQTVAGLSGLLEISVGGGLSLTKSNNQKQFNADGGVSYETPGYRAAFSFSSIFTTQQETVSTNRQNFRLEFDKRLSPRWGLGALGDFLTSQEQQLDLRTIVGGGPTYDAIRRERLNLRLIGGLVWNNERYDVGATVTPTENGLEGLAGLYVSWFRFRQWNLDSTLFVFPSISVAGRVRMDWNTSLKYRLIRGQSLWWNLSQTVNLDSRPPATLPGSDYVTTTSISWSFP
jgi:Protein of unknown function, DUF481